MSGGHLRDDLLMPRPGDEVFIRGRVKRADGQRTDDLDVLVELFSRTDQYEVWVRRDSIEQVIPVDQTRTFMGFTVTQTREAILQLDRVIGAHKSYLDTDPSPAMELVLASLEDSRNDLAHQLEQIGAAVYVDEGQQ